jgi:hypothetical protein
MKMKLRVAGLALAISLGGCGGGDESRGGLSAEEERQLDNAAAMLDENMLTVPDDSLVANEAELDAVDAESSQPANDSGNQQ